MNTEMNKVLEIDEIAENGVYCIAPTNEDLQIFAEHAKNEKEKKKNRAPIKVLF